jgi:hypothetical protein
MIFKGFFLGFGHACSLSGNISGNIAKSKYGSKLLNVAVFTISEDDTGLASPAEAR